MSCPFQSGYVPKDQLYNNQTVTNTLVACNTLTKFLSVTNHFKIPIVDSIINLPVAPEGSIVFDKETLSLWYSDGTKWVELISSSNFKIPIVPDVTIYPVKEVSSLVYDLNTNTIWYSDGLQWLPIATIPSVPNALAYTILQQGSLIFDQQTNTVWMSDGTQWLPITSTPPVPDASVFQIMPAGTLIFDQNTQTVWYSDGSQWFPVDSNTSGVVTPSLTIYANAGTGNDSNDGLTPGTAVQTIQKALNIISTFLVYNGTIQLLGATPFDLGTDGSLNFFPASSRVGNLKIKGTRLNETIDTVASVAHNIGPFNTWTQITGNNGGYTPSEYQAWFANNNTKNAFYTILDNAANTVDTIAGNGAPNGQIDAWDIGDSFSLYSLESTITFSGTLSLLNSGNDSIVFQDVWIQPNIGSTWKNPLLPVTTYNSCRLDTNSSLSYAGSMNLNGIYSENTSTSTAFCALESGACRLFNSAWLNGPSVAFNENCSAIFFYSLNCQSMLEGRSFIVEGNFTGYSMMLVGFIGAVVLEIVAGVYNISYLYAENTTASDTPPFSVNCRILNCGDSSLGVLENAELIQHSTANFVPQVIVVGFNGRLYTKGTQIWTSDSGSPNGTIIEGFAGAVITIFAETLTATSNNSSPMISLQNNSTCGIRTNVNYVNSWTNSAGNVATLRERSAMSMQIQDNGGVVTFTGNSTTSLFDLDIGSSLDILLASLNSLTFTNTNLDGSGILCDHGSTYNIDAMGTLTYSTNQSGGSITKATVVLLHGSSANTSAAITDAGATNVNVLIYGTVVVAGPGPYSTTVNDFASGTPQNCAISFG